MLRGAILRKAERGGINRWLVVFSVCAASFLTGCCGPLIRSHRASPAGEPDFHSSDCRPVFPDRAQALCRPFLHYIAGPFTPRDIAAQYQTTVRPPHSKFHPIPTRPVFLPPLPPEGPMLVPTRSELELQPVTPLEEVIPNELPIPGPEIRQPDESTGSDGDATREFDLDGPKTVSRYSA